MKKTLFAIFILLVSVFSPSKAQQSLISENVRTMNAIIPDFQVNENEGLCESERCPPSISVDNDGNFVISWEDARGGDIDIYAQRFKSDGTALGSNFKVNDDTVNVYQGNQDVSTDRNGNFVITWEDDRDGDRNIYAQLYANDGTAVGINFNVLEDSLSVKRLTPSIATAANGNFIITWVEDYWVYQGIHAQRFCSDGSLLGTSFRVNTDSINTSAYSPSISSDSTGNFIITWVKQGYYESDIYAQRYASDGTVLDKNFKVNTDSLVGYNMNPSVSVSSNGNFIITWHINEEDDYDIYAQRYAADGTSLGGNLKVNDSTASEWQQYPCISSDAMGNIIITWTDYRNGFWENPDIYAQRYANNGDALGKNFRLTNTGFRPQIYSSVELWNGRIYNTWMDSRTEGTRYDIWANVLDWDNPIGLSEKEKSLWFSDYILSQNYPNPFNPVTTISYQLPVPSEVELNIYNILGQKMATLVSDKQPAGRYNVEWDASGFASGVYLYKLQSSAPLGKPGQGYIQTKKLVVLK